MSATIINNLIIELGEAATALEEIGVVAGVIATPISVIVSASITATIGIVKLFNNIWNSKRQEINGIITSIETAISKSKNIGIQMQNFFTKWNTIKNDTTKKNKLVLEVLKKNINIDKVISLLEKVDKQLFNQVVSWTTTLALAYIAKTDNAFYTLNRGDVDTLINAYTSSTSHIESLENAVKKILDDLEKIIQMIDEGFKISVQTIGNLTIPRPWIGLPATDQGETGTIDELVLKGVISAAVGELLKRIVQATTRNKVREGKRQKPPREKKKWKKRKRKNKKKKPPKTIKEISVFTYDVSQWIAKVKFIFPVKKDINSDDRGTIIFTLKKGGIIKFFRVKRGTFSVIASVYGTGYRLWSQFWKRKLVRKPPHPEPVLSWFIKRINQQDREIAIPLEIKNTKIKYK